MKESSFLIMYRKNSSFVFNENYNAFFIAIQGKIACIPPFQWYGPFHC